MASFFFLSMQYKMSDHCFTIKDIRASTSGSFLKLEKEIFSNRRGLWNKALSDSWSQRRIQLLIRNHAAFSTPSIFLSYLLLLTLKETSKKKPIKGVRTQVCLGYMQLRETFQLQDANFFTFFPVDVAINIYARFLLAWQ